MSAVVNVRFKNAQEGLSPLIRLQNINLNESLGKFINEFQEKNNGQMDKSDIVVFSGRTLNNKDTSLNEYGITNESTIYFIQNPISNDNDSEINNDAISQCLKEFPVAIKSSRRLNSIFNQLSKSSTWNLIYSKYPKIQDDSTALDYLKNLSLLKMLKDPDMCKSVLDSHPILADVLLFIDNFDRKNGSSTTVKRPKNYSIDALSDESEEEGSEQAARGQPSADHISRALLEAALQSTDNPSQSNQASSSGGISHSFFQDALQRVLSGGTVPASNSQQNPMPSTSSADSVRESQVRQLLEMGITSDEDVARHALEATQGNMELAVQIILGEQ